MKDLIYYPSLSAGGCAGDFKKNKEVLIGKHKAKIIL